MFSIISFLFLLILQKNKYNCFRCGADLIKKNPKIIELNNTNAKRSLSTEYTPLKIKYDYSYLINQNLLKDQDLNDLKNRFDDVSNYLNSLLSVNHQAQQLDTKLIEDYCEIDIYSPDIKNYLLTYDIIIIPIINTDLDYDILAQAWTCLTSKKDNNPILGIVEINKDFNLDKFDSYLIVLFYTLHKPYLLTSKAFFHLQSE